MKCSKKIIWFGTYYYLFKDTCYKRKAELTKTDNLIVAVGKKKKVKPLNFLLDIRRSQ